MKIYTIGHSILTLNKFIQILIKNKIRCLVDVRSYPASKYVPYFNKDNLKKSLAQYKIKYYHIAELGGRRRYVTTVNTSIESPSFSSYAEYMMMPPFAEGMDKLKKIASKCTTAFMCSEGQWYRCHRRMISDRLEYDGWGVYHLGSGKPIRHEIWNISRLDENGYIIYDQ